MDDFSKLYLDNKELNKLKKELKDLESYKLKSDDILGTDNSKLKDIDYIIEKFPKNNKKKIKITKKK